MKYIASWLLTLLLVFAGAAAVAQTQPPLMGSEAAPELPAATSPSTAEPNTTTDTSEFRILVIGDELAGGLGAGMTRMAEADPNLQILNRFNELSGLARTELHDWPTALTKITATNPVDAVVVLVGINDRQAIRTDGGRIAFRETGWQETYTANVDRLADAVKAANARLYWISIPPIASPEIDADMRFLSDIHRLRVAAKGGNFVDVRPFFLSPDGSFAERGPDETGIERKLRARDGITFMKQGNSRFGQLVLGAIKTIESQSKPDAVEQPAEQLATKVQPAPAVQIQKQEEVGISLAPVPPTFGQEGLDGELITFRADIAMGKATPQTKSVEQKTAAKSITIDNANKILAKTGTQSAKLLTEGLPPAAPAGRFDDFAVPAVQ